MKYWIGVACKNHVQRGITGGFAQLGHGKRSGVAKLRAGDWIVYYSPRTELKGGETIQAFTGIGQVIREEVYQVSSSESFCPYRRDVRFLKASDAPIKPLLSSLSFIKDPKRWGYPFRAGQLEITEQDFALISSAMSVQDNTA